MSTAAKHPNQPKFKVGDLVKFTGISRVAIVDWGIILSNGTPGLDARDGSTSWNYKIYWVVERVTDQFFPGNCIEPLK